MATLLRSVIRARRILNVSWQTRKLIQPCCMISTSKKKTDGISSTIENIDKPLSSEEELKALEEHFGNADPTADKNWRAWGFDFKDRDHDDFIMNMSVFWLIQVILAMSFFYLYHDKRLRSWAKREAFLELDRREKLGLPDIDRNYVDPARVTLPSEEELGDMHIRL